MTGNRRGSWRLEAGNWKGRSAQAALEMCLALIGVMLLVFGCLKMFLWFTTGYVIRQRNYERTRVTAGNRAPNIMPMDTPTPPVVKWKEPDELDVFNERTR